jgi:AcrR family transcriptional regulator
MTPQERRSAIVAATLPLLAEQGATVTTGQIAAASGVAEGTVFRAFADKNELMWACLQAAFDPAEPIAALARIPRELPVAQRLLQASTAVAEHWDRAMQIGHAVRSTCPVPPATERQARSETGEKMQALNAAVADLLAPDAADLRLSPQRTAQLFLLAVTSDRMLRMRMAGLGAPAATDVEELIEVFLHGALRGEHG